MKVCIVSDVHLELNGYSPKLDKLKKGGDLLIIAGDLTLARIVKSEHPQAISHKENLKKFVEKWCSKFNSVIYVVGNHEHYNYFFRDTVQTMKDYFKDSNVHVLENESFEKDGILFLCSTLWTDFQNGDKTEMYRVEYGMNDYRIIYTKPEEEITYIERNHPNQRIKYGILSAENTYQHHLISRMFLHETLKKNPDKKTVIVTHHCPMFHCNNSARHGVALLSGYCSDLEWMMQDHEQISHWICGHTHYKFDFMVNKTRVLSNPLGYNGEPQYDSFKPLFIEI